jgi:hypothetical protein
MSRVEIEFLADGQKMTPAAFSIVLGIKAPLIKVREPRVLS